MAGGIAMAKVSKKRKYNDLRIWFQDFHFFKNEEYPPEISFCLIVLKDGTVSCGQWWPYSDEERKGRFIRGTADSVEKKDVEAWLSLDRWDNLEVLQDQKVNCITVGSDEDYVIKIEGFHSIANGELPQDGQYCLLQLYDGKMSGGRWSSGGPYLKTGFFNHAPAAGIIDAKEVWAWAALDPWQEKLAEYPKVMEEKPAEEKPEKRRRTEAELKKKFRYGYDVKVYVDKGMEKLRENYPWVTKKNLDRHYRFAIEKEDGDYEFIEYYKSGKKESRSVLTGYSGDMDAEQFISHFVFCHESYVIYNNKVVEEYKVPYEPVEMIGGWRLEKYVFSKRASGDYTVYVQAGDRVTGSGRDFGISAKCFEQPTFDKFLDEYIKIVPGNIFGLTKEDLIKDDKLKEFLGYADREKK